MIGAVDIGGTKIAVGLVQSDGRILLSDRFATAEAKDYSEFLTRVENMLQGLVTLCGDCLSGVGIGSTGRMNADGTFQPNKFLPFLEGKNLAVDLNHRFAVRTAVENDADAAALGEYRWGAGAGSRRMIFVTVSTGIGGGIVLDGRLYRGVDGAHPEIGHHVIEPGGPRCFCGAYGCWERLASGTAMAEWMAEQSGREDIDAREICELADRKDGLAVQAVHRTAHYLGIGLANLITLFAPDCIVLGGGVMNRWDLFEKEVRLVIRHQCGLVPWEKVNLVKASLGSQSGLMGAASVWWHRYE